MICQAAAPSFDLKSIKKNNSVPENTWRQKCEEDDRKVKKVHGESGFLNQKKRIVSYEGGRNFL